ncbi:hypothetical protein B5X24_HaOG208004 [Helicoverpa armigera]|uniref:YqaJ viral recombinase domain-containing protein n=1 Tax=Helicoverpa armigera TaxID=29058 RepID=A0A2W1BGX5_HELAM|nr:hypothetical protein B5X24_HaOG208004 [Helicoverpa armigera]
MKVYAKQLQQNKKTFFSRATSHGIINEKIALHKYCEMYDLIAEPCGLFISKERPHLAASPDALLGSETTIEIKCPYASRSRNITSTSVPYLYEINGILNLNKNSPYYYQIQGQSYCTNRKYCNLKKEKILKSSRIDSTGNIQKANESCLQASYKIAYRIARNKKPHTIGEDLIKPCLLDAVTLVIGEQHVAKIKQISLSNTTIHEHIFI